MVSNQPPQAEPRLTGGEYRALVEQAPLMIWRSDTTMGCDYFNAKWLAFTGRTLAQEQGDGWAAGVHPEDLQRCLEIYTSCFSRREAFEMEYRLRRSDGTYRWIHDRGVPYAGEDGRFAGSIGSCTDVTGQVEAQALRRQEHERELQHLRGLLPICCSCKRIKDDDGYWEQIERYLRAHAEVEFSHGYCPECAARFKQEALAHLSP